MKKHHISPWIAFYLLVLSMTVFACAELSLPSAEGNPCGNSTECAGLICDPQTMTCQKPLEDPDAGTSDGGNNLPNDSGNNSSNDSGNNTDTTPRPPTTFSGCTDDTQCAGYQSCNVARGRCEDTRQSCTDTSTCAAGQICEAGLCNEQCTNDTDCADGLSCFTINSNKLCMAPCTDFSAHGTDCAPDTHCIPYFGTSGGLCKGTGRKHQGDNCLNDGDPDSCQPGHTCLNLGKQRTCQQLCAGNDPSICTGDTYCEPFFYGTDPNASADDAGACLNDCNNTNGQPDKSLCPPEHTCLASSDTGKSFCVADDGGGLDAPCVFSDQSNGCAIGLACLASGHGATTGNIETGVCTNLCDPTKNPTGCFDGYACVQRGTGHPATEGVCIKSCEPHKSAATNGCPLGRERCLPETDGAVPAVAGLCTPAGNLTPGETCSFESPMACSGDTLCTTSNQTMGYDSTQSSGTCNTYCASFDYTNPGRCPTGQVCGFYFYSDKLGYCTNYRTSTGQNSGERCDDTTENQGKWCNDNLLCDYWNGQFLSCEIPCFTDQPNICPTGKSCDTINSSGNPTLGYCR